MVSDDDCYLSPLWTRALRDFQIDTRSDLATVDRVLLQAAALALCRPHPVVLYLPTARTGRSINGGNNS